MSPAETPAEGVAPAELARWLTRIESSLQTFRHEVGDELRGVRTELVRRDVYEAHRLADDLRARAIEADLAKRDADQQRRDAERSADRRLVWAAVLSAVGSAGVSVAMQLMG